MEILHPGHERTKTANIAGPVQAFIDKLEPAPGVTYALVSAMSYSEYFGPNSNTDWYGYNKHLNFNGLLHQWPEFGREPELDAIKGRNWPHGYPCFYAATAYAHHRNTDPKSLGFGDVVFVYANPHMKRIELVIRIFNDEAEKKGHRSIIDRIERNERVDVSMGAKIPFDACSVCTDWDRVRDAMTRFDPAKHRHHMMPVLEEHKRHAIRGIAETRKQYCVCMRTMAGRVNDDGQLVFVYNDAPRFFDISFVLIGADRTSRVMWHLPSLRGERPAQMPPGMILDSMGTPMSGLKIASMDKDSPGVAVNALDAAHHGYDFSGVMAACRSHKPKSVLASLAALGIIASPREFSALLTGAPTDFDTQVSGADRTFEPRGVDVQDSLVKAFAPLVEPRSSFAACQTAERPEGGRERICVVVAAPDLARKYAGYRLGLIKHAGELFSHGQDPVKIAAQGPGLLLGRPGVIQWFSSHVVPDLGSASVETITKLSSMIRTTQDLMKVGNALDGVLRVSNTSSLWTAVEDVAEATCYL